MSCMYMTYTLVLNSTNAIGSSNSEYQYNFKSGSFTVRPNSEICVSQIVIPYSWFNIDTTYYKNATLQYNWFNGSSYNTYTVVYPNGFYTISDLNNYLQLFMMNQNHYLINTLTGQNLFFITLSSNVTYYGNQLLCYCLPTSIPSGYTAPSNIINGFSYTGFNCNPTTAGSSGGNGNFFASSGWTPQLIIPAYTDIYGIGSILGFSAGSYPSIIQTNNYNKLSNHTPNATPVNSVVVRCNIVNNDCAIPSDILDVFYPAASFGSNITYAPSYEKWVHIKEGSYTQITVVFQDQNFRTLHCNDNNILIALLLKQGEDVEKASLKEDTPVAKITKPMVFRDDIENDT